MAEDDVMPLGGSITGVLFADFTFVNEDGLLNPGQNGPFTLPPDAQATLAQGATMVDINVLDDDELFDDGYQDDATGKPPNQFLRDDINAVDAAGNPVFVGAGTLLEVEFTLTAFPSDGSDPIDLLFVAAGPGENQGDLTLVVSTAPLVPGIKYNLAFKNDGGGTPYGEIICFARGTLIRTPSGDVPVEQLRVGDRIVTYDHGVQPIRWMARRMVLWPSVNDMPIRVAEDAFGPGRPYKEVWLSPRHLVLDQDARHRVLFDDPEVLIAAQDSLERPGVSRAEDCKAIEYHHFMLDTHDLVWANGMLAETFRPGPVARRTLDPGALEALIEIHPELRDPHAPAPFDAARRIVRGYEHVVAGVAGLVELRK